MAIVFAILQALLAWFGHRRTVAPAEEASKAQSDLNVYVQSKLRNAEVIESMGMLGGLRARWAERHKAYMHKQGSAQGLAHRIQVYSKFLRYCQQSFALAAGALLTA